MTDRIRGYAADELEEEPMEPKHRYEDLTWPEVNDAVEGGLIPLLPVGTLEQHGPHLPVKMDKWTADAVADEAARRRPDRLLCMPVIAYGYTTHVMDFPGSVTVHHETLTRYVVDVLKSLAYHGFKKLIVINGHGSNIPPLELAARRVMLETDAVVSLTSWWPLLTVDPNFVSGLRESHFPGGAGHAGEFETSFGRFLDDSLVNMDVAEDHETWTNEQGSRYEYIDLFGVGPVSISSWTSTFSGPGTTGEATLATPEKGRAIFEEVTTRLIEWADEFHGRVFNERVDHHRRKPTTAVPG